MDGPDHATAGDGIGARVRRKEDARHLAGHGQFVGDIRIAGMRDVAFFRSPVAHARIMSRAKPVGAERDVFFLADLAGVQPIVTRSAIPGYKLSEWPAMAAIVSASSARSLPCASRKPARVRKILLNGSRWISTNCPPSPTAVKASHRCCAAA